MSPVDPHQSEVASRLTALRVASGLTQRTLARRSGIPASVLCAYERGSRIPAADTFLRIVRAAGGDVVVHTRSLGQLQAADAALQDVLALAELLPLQPRGELTFPPLRTVRVDVTT